MSAYITLETPMIDRACLLAALEEMGFGSGCVEVHEEPVELVGYRGRARTQRAHIIVRREHLSSSSNDMGFLRTESGYRAIISDYDRAGRLGRSWMTQLRESYARHEEHRRREDARRRREMERQRREMVRAQREEIEAMARKRGYKVERAQEGKKVKLVLRKRVY